MSIEEPCEHCNENPAPVPTIFFEASKLHLCRHRRDKHRLAIHTARVMMMTALFPPEKTE